MENLLKISWTSLWDKVLNWSQTAGIMILRVLLIAFIGLIAIHFIMKIVKKIMTKSGISKIAMSFILAITKFLLNIFLILIILQNLGISITAFVAALSAIGLAVALSLQASFTNLVNGIIIILTKPFEVDDYISVSGVEGTVDKITIFSTKIITVDNKVIIVPNGDITTKTLTNYNALPTRKVIYNFTTNVNSNVAVVKDIAVKVMESCGLVYLDQDHSCTLKGFENGNQNYMIVCWCDSEDYWTVLNYIIENLFNQLMANKISLSLNKVEISQKCDDCGEICVATLPERIEKVRDEKKSHKSIGEMFENKIKKIAKKQTKKDSVKTKPAKEKKSKNKKEKKSKTKKEKS